MADKKGTGREIVKPLIITTVFLLLTLGACVPSPAGEDISQGQLVTNLPNGVLVNEQRTDLVTRWRGPMDHGSGVQADRVRFRAWEAIFTNDRLQLQSYPIDFVWNRGLFSTGDSPNFLNPSFLKADGKFIPNGCFNGTITAVKEGVTQCLPSTGAPHVVQMGGRNENVTVAGRHVTFANGLDDEAKPCTLDLEQIATDAALPIMVNAYAANVIMSDNAHYESYPLPAYRFAVSYLPPQYAYMIDYGAPEWPIYRVSCSGFQHVGQLLPLPNGVMKSADEKDKASIMVLDMVEDVGQKMPAIFLSVPEGDGGMDLMVLRAGRKPQEIPYFCEDCLPGIGGFFMGSPDWLLFEARLNDHNKIMTLSLQLYDLKADKEVTKTVTAPYPDAWPK